MAKGRLSNMRWPKPLHLFFIILGASMSLILFTRILSPKTSYVHSLTDWVPSAAEITNGISDSIGKSSIKTRMEHSESLWSKTVAQRRKIIEEYGNVGFFPSKDKDSYAKTPFSVWDLIPASYNCPMDVERIGRMGDGGKWVCGMSQYEKNKKPCVLYSFGVTNETSFETSMLERTNCELWGYGSEVTGFGDSFPPDLASRAHFTHASVAGHMDKNQNPPQYTIQDLMEINGHTYVDILKMDIEYSEFNAISSLNAVTSPQPPLPAQDFPLGQILVEFHLFDWQGIDFPSFMDWWASIEWRGLRPTWTEPNLLAVSMGFEDGNARLAEYTLLNVKDRRNMLYT